MNIHYNFCGRRRRNRPERHSTGVVLLHVCRWPCRRGPMTLLVSASDKGVIGTMNNVPVITVLAPPSQSFKQLLTMSLPSVMLVSGGAVCARVKARAAQAVTHRTVCRSA